MKCKHPCCGDECRKPKKPGIKKMSVKRAAQNTIYKQKRNAYLKSHPFCEAKLKHCEKIADQIHHKKGRIGELLTDETNFLAVCWRCHFCIEMAPEDAKEQGFSVSRLSDYDAHSSYPGSED